ncbi:hypothetical protein [Prochlorococcus sp. MIT 0916]|uniref:hypothetical protein n=1 Tax=Prochlorococcus sp. MIT 0916 TaxID=3082521 RepID=UPI0039B46A63
MEQVTDAIGNPTALLIERIFWLGLGGFLGLAIITSSLRGLKETKNKTTPVSTDQLENLAKKAIQQNSNSN